MTRDEQIVLGILPYLASTPPPFILFKETKTIMYTNSHLLKWFVF